MNLFLPLKCLIKKFQIKQPAKEKDTQEKFTTVS